MKNSVVFCISLIILLLSSKSYSANPYPVIKNGHLVYIDSTGMIVIDNELETPYEEGEIEIFGKKYSTYIIPEWAYFSEGKATFVKTWGWWFIRIGKEYGVLDSKGKIVIPPQEFLIWSFKNGIARTTISLKSFDYTYSEEFAFRNVDDYLHTFTYALPINSKNIIDSAVAVRTFEYCGDFSEGYAVVLDKDIDGISKYFYTDTNLNFLNNSGFDDIRNFSEGKGVVMLDSLWGVINSKGEFIVKPKFKYLWQYKNGLARYFDGKNFGFIDANGNIKFNNLFISAGDFSCGYSLVQHVNNEYHFIDTTGNFINLNFISDRQKNYQKGFTAAGNFSDNLAPVMIDGRWGYINTNGELAIPSVYDYALEFRDGFAQVWEGKIMNIINTHGKIVWTYNFD